VEIEVMTRLPGKAANVRRVPGWSKILFSLLPLLSIACVPAVEPASGREVQAPGGTTLNADAENESGDGTQLATFGAGCFWCVEAVFQELEGVISVESGYCGGQVKNPTYQQVCTGQTGHAEVCQIRFDPKKISFDELLEVFWKTHDPTTLNRQGPDVGTQYRSVIFYHDDQQKQQAAARKAQLNAAKLWPRPIVTEISPIQPFYKAEAYHQNYFVDNPRQPYCQMVVGPKVSKFRKIFRDKLKTTGD
jgi:peptide-methionine (S)-S-oxide reductase